MQKIDYKKILKHLYDPSAKNVAIVEPSAMNFLMIDGVGDPNPNTSTRFQQAVEALFKVSYTLKFMVKKGAIGIDYGVMPLEGLWWADDMEDFVKQNKAAWKWTLLMMQPEFISGEMVEEAKEQAQRKKDLPAIPDLRFETFAEGQAAQIMHIGPFSEEGPTVQKVHEFIAEQGRQLSGKHHEIYLSDIRRAAPEKWKTVIRQPFV